MGDETVFMRRSKSLLKEHGKTAIGGVGGASLVTILAVAMPYIHDIKDSQSKLWQENANLKERVTKLEVQVQDLKESNKK